ncbi:MAG: ATP-grasp domain-containing protein, partial [Alphaproteobacteria bacterium]
MTDQPDFPLPPLSTIGILGGGQLGRMLAVAAAELGFRTHIFCPEVDSPAFDVAHACTIAAYDDADALAKFAGAVDVATYEFENVPLDTAQRVADLVALRPGLKPLRIAQDRLDEKKFLQHMGARTAPYWPVSSALDLEQLALDDGRYVLKTRRLGYDGKGQASVSSKREAEQAFAEFGAVPAILEAFVAFEMEISVVLARSTAGEVRAFEIGHNIHENHMLAQTLV